MDNKGIIFKKLTDKWLIFILEFQYKKSFVFINLVVFSKILIIIAKDVIVDINIIWLINNVSIAWKSVFKHKYRIRYKIVQNLRLHLLIFWVFVKNVIMDTFTRIWVDNVRLINLQQKILNNKCLEIEIIRK